MAKQYRFLGQNADAEVSEQQEGDFRDSLNLIPVRLADSKGSRRENVRSTVQIPYTLPAGANGCIGSVEDQDNGRLIFFVYNSNGDHGIYMLEADGTTVTTVIQDSVLDFALENRVAHAKVVGPYLVWADGGRNDARYIDIDRAVRTTNALPGTTYPLPWENGILTLNKPVPVDLLEVVYNSSGESSDLAADSYWQFQYRYIYADGTTSAFSPTTRTYPSQDPTVTNPALPIQGFQVELDTSVVSAINDDIVALEFAARNKFGSYFIGETFERDAVGAWPVNGAGDLEWDFRTIGSQIGIPDSEQSVQFYNIGIKPKALEVADERVFLANYQSGYERLNRYDTSSRTVGLRDDYSVIAGATLTTYSFYPGNLEGIPYAGTIDVVLHLGEYWVVEDRVHRTGTLKTIVHHLIGFATDITNGNATAGASVNVDVYVPKSITSGIGFKSSSSYQIGIVFFDPNGIPSEVVTTDDWKFDTPELEIPSNAWIDLGAGADTDIPEWATSYRIVITRNNRTDFFLSGYASRVIYFEEQGTLISASASAVDRGTYSPDVNFIGIDLQGFIRQGRGYSFTDGDRIRVWIENIVYDVKIENFDGRYVYIKPFDPIGSIISPEGHFRSPFEIYTPAGTIEGAFYEVGNAYEITDPGTISRAYSQPVVELLGDTYFFQDAGEILSEAEYGSFGGAAYTNFETDKPHTVYYESITTLNDNTTSQWQGPWGNPFLEASPSASNDIELTNSYQFGQRLIQDGVAGNFINQFFPGDSGFIDSDRGDIVKLTATTDAGTTILVTCTRTCSALYIRKAYVTLKDTTEALTRTDGVIGDERKLKYDYGTEHPESVVEWDGSIFFFDHWRGEMVRYSNNGLTPISTAGRVRSIFKHLGEEYTGASGGPAGNVITGFDQDLDFMFATFIGPGQDVTRAFDEATNRWSGRFSFLPECYGRVGDRFYSFKLGSLYQHNRSTDLASNPNTYNTFYAVGYDSEMEIEAFINEVEQEWRSIAVHSNQPFQLPAMTNSLGQSTSILTADFGNFNGRELDRNQWYYEILRDENTDASLLSGSQIALKHGLPMRSRELLVKLSRTTTSYLELLSMFISSDTARGHLVEFKRQR